MEQQVFVAGHGGSGTRVVQLILQMAGYNTGQGDTNAALDYIQEEFHDPLINTVWHGDKNYNFLSNIEATEPKPFSIKEGHLMLLTPQIKQWYPNSKFILVMRHPLDNILKEDYQVENTYGRIFYPRFCSLQDKLLSRLLIWCHSYQDAMVNTDLVVRLEDMVYQLEVEIATLFDFLEINKEPRDFIPLIERPLSIGRAVKELDEGRYKALMDLVKSNFSEFGYWC